jgi:hypothetical protein
VVRVTVHYNPGAEWQAKRISYFVDGLKNLGFDVEATQSQRRINGGPVVLFGTSAFRRIEAEPGDWLLVDRASIGDPEYVSLVWNGHGRRGDHMVPSWHDESRWEDLGVELWPQVWDGDDVVICGQTEPYSPNWNSMMDWYASIPDATHFRPHPAGDNPTGLPVKTGWENGRFHVLNSSVGVEALIKGRIVTVHDEGAMSYGVEDREQWAHWLAWTQWHWDEIREGDPIGHLFGRL